MSGCVRSGNWANRVQMVRYKRFIGNKEEEGEFFEDGDLSYFAYRYCLKFID